MLKYLQFTFPASTTCIHTTISHGQWQPWQVVSPYLGSSACHNHQTSVRSKPAFRGPLLPVRVHSQAPLSAKSASSTQSLSLVSTASSPLAPLSVRSLGKGSVTSKLMLGSRLRSRFDQPSNSNGLGWQYSKVQILLRSLFNGVLFAFKYAFDLILNTELPIKLGKTSQLWTVISSIRLFLILTGLTSPQSNQC